MEDLTKDRNLTGSKIITAGVGTLRPGTEGTGTISITVPSGVLLKTSLHIGRERHRKEGVYPNGDSQIKINGVSINGELVGKANQEGTSRGFVFRADITGQGFISNGTNILNVTEFVGPVTANDRADGAGVMVVIDDGTKASLEVKDGADWAYLKLTLLTLGYLLQRHKRLLSKHILSKRKADLSLFVGDIGSWLEYTKTTSFGNYCWRWSSTIY